MQVSVEIPDGKYCDGCPLVGDAHYGAGYCGLLK
ncbi:hypothetical protein LCGC14_2450590 [marine sediment metagenome]|uniref:Uncharacterized protein n=1 Tax=marine sediment metagenome TaxID=412755 RepID=A0A0F9EA40_9ZZZZ